MKRSKKFLYIIYCIIIAIGITALGYYCVEVKSCASPYTFFSSCISGNYKYNGTYYYTTSVGRDKSRYFILKDNEWEDSDGLSGTYDITSKGVIIFYMRNTSEEFVRGTVGGGVLEINMLLTTLKYTTEKVNIVKR